MHPYEILIVDDHTAVREGVKAILSQMRGVQCDDCGSIEQLTGKLAAGLRPNLYILDMEFPGADVFDVLAIIQRHHPKGNILIYTCHDEPWLLSRITGDHICGFVSKSSTAQKLQEAVSAIRAGGTAFDECFLRARESSSESISTTNEELSLRERQVLEYMTQGLSTREIAEKMHLSIFTVKTYRSRLLRKLHARNAVDVVVKGKKYRLQNDQKSEDSN